MIEYFKNNVDDEIFRSTNQTYNDLRLNSSWYIGNMSYICNNIDFNSKEDFEDYYYESGGKRLTKIKKMYKINHLSNQALALMSDISDKKNVQSKYHILNYNYGRTIKQLNKLAIKLHSIHHEIPLKTCEDIIKYRTIGESFNGLVVREKNTITILSNLYPEFEFRKMNAVLDIKYSIDYEIYDKDKLKLGLQIKPLSYKNGMNTTYIKEVHKMNMELNRNYIKDFNVNVCVIYSDLDGNIHNLNDLKNLL